MTLVHAATTVGIAATVAELARSVRTLSRPVPCLGPRPTPPWRRESRTMRSDRDDPRSGDARASESRTRRMSADTERSGVPAMERDAFAHRVRRDVCAARTRWPVLRRWARGGVAGVE